MTPIKKVPNTLPFLTALAFGLAVNPASAESSNIAPSQAADGMITSYPAVYFEQYRPATALDMVRQLPGFQLDDGEDRRGFGGTAGNLLIDDRYPSAKQNRPSDILTRISASQVKKIELIRGQVREIDLQGRSIVANLVLTEDAAAPVQWELTLRRNFQMSPLAPTASISTANRWRGIEYTVGMDGRRGSYGDPGVEYLFDGEGRLVENRIDDHEGGGFDANGYINAVSQIGETLLRMNSSLGFVMRNEDLVTEHQPLSGEPPHDEMLDKRRRNRIFEMGIDAERLLQPDLLGKAILLFHQVEQKPRATQRTFDPGGNRTLFRRADTRAEAEESIGRLEFDWSAIRNHVVQLNVEVARNTLENALVQIIDIGNGPEAVAVPGANSRVEELRTELLVSDTWTVGNAEINYGIAAEASRMSQSGDEDLERSFFFVKPHAVLTYAGSASRQTLLRVAREVSQLDFQDFVSATEFDDDDLALGNPNLRPETTWVAELSQEWRFGDYQVLKTTIFHHWISDVEDLLPLTAVFEVPGNIGDGRRWGAEVEATFPLEWIGLRNARLNLKGRLQDSTVTDPVTGGERVLSAAGGHDGDIVFRDENRHAVIADFRQDFEALRLSWGWKAALRAERPLFKVNELDIYDEDPNVDIFVETTRWLGMKMRLEGLNLLNRTQLRDRTVYFGERGNSPVLFRERRHLTAGSRVMLILSGSF